MSKRSSYSHQSQLIINKIWGCLADSTQSSQRYDKYCDVRQFEISIRGFWSEREVKLFCYRLADVFNIEIDIDRNEKMCHLIKRIRKIILMNDRREYDKKYIKPRN